MSQSTIANAMQTTMQHVQTKLDGPQSFPNEGARYQESVNSWNQTLQMHQLTVGRYALYVHYCDTYHNPLDERIRVLDTGKPIWFRSGTGTKY
jgi:hypothetical protein